MQTLAPDLLAKPVAGRNLAGPTFGDQLAGGPRLVVFLRHLG